MHVASFLTVGKGVHGAGDVPEIFTCIWKSLDMLGLARRQANDLKLPIFKILIAVLLAKWTYILQIL